MHEFLRRTWAQINLDAINNNCLQIKSLLKPSTRFCAVVKADCYGHGYAYTAQEFEQAGADWFAVSNLAEALQLRRAGIQKPILILGYTPPDKAAQLVYNDISQAVFSTAYARALSWAAVQSGVTVNAHFKLDTGMSRIGFLYHDTFDNAKSIEELANACTLKGLRPEGIFTHFARADSVDGELFTRLQFELFCTAIDLLKAKGIEFEIRHCANSAAILTYPETHLDMVRAGIILYGGFPSAQTPRNIRLLPVMELKAVVSMLKTVPPETPVSYGGTYVSQNERLIATVPIGYADGYPRSLSNRTQMLINGLRAPVLGNICMDQTMLDVTDIPQVTEGDIVTVFGADHGAYLSVDELAERANTINYEILCSLSRRVPRIYIRNNEIIATTDYML